MDENKKSMLDQIISACHTINVNARLLEEAAESEGKKKHYHWLYQEICVVEEHVKVEEDIPLL